jgi:ribonuclease P protein component
VIYVAASPEERAARVGIVVGKSVGGSVERHRVARRIRGAVAPLVPRLPVGSRVLIRALPGASADPSLAADVAVGLERALGGTP